MNIKKKLGLGAAGLVTLGGSMFGLTLVSGAASASSNPPSTVATTANADQGLNIQEGSQTSVDTSSSALGEGITSEGDSEAVATSTESAATADGAAGHQDPAGNVDNQSTSEQ